MGGGGGGEEEGGWSLTKSMHSIVRLSCWSFPLFGTSIVFLLLWSMLQRLLRMRLL